MSKMQLAVTSEQLLVFNERFESNNKTSYLTLLSDNCSLLPVIDLQWFADDDDDPDAAGKNIEATETKLRKLREEEGQVPKSNELVGAIGLLLCALVLVFTAPSILNNCIEMVRFFFLRAVELDTNFDGGIIAGVFFRYFINITWPVLLIAVISAIFTNIAQAGGWIFTLKPITPDFSKMTKFGQYFRRIFSVEGLFNLGKSLVKIVVIGFISFLFIRADIEKLLNLQKAHPYASLLLIAGIAIRLIIVVAIILIIISIGDYFFQRYRFRQRHRMTPREFKEEWKQSNQDPYIESRIRARFRELLRQNIGVTVPKADVVITNPTHLAVALQYEPKSMPDGPLIVAMGEDEFAARIRKIAQDNGVPLVENKPLAWALFKETRVGQHIPYEHWNAVAVILKNVWHLNERRRRQAA